MEDNKDLTAEILLTAGAAALVPHAPLAAAGVAGMVPLLRAGLRWVRRKSAQGTLNTAIAEMSQDQAIRKLVREEVAEVLGEKEQAAYRNFLSTVIDINGPAPADAELLKELANGLICVLGQHLEQVSKVVADGLCRSGHRRKWPSEQWVRPQGDLRDRFWWRAKDGPPPVDDGFLLNTHGLLGLAAPTLHTLAELDHIPCLVLAGEPGSGKSVEIGKAWQAADTSASDDLVSRLDLRAYGDETRLEADLDVVFDAWEASGSMLRLYLDSLDECRVRVRTVASMLARRIKDALGEPDRIRIRIGCRTADLPAQFGELLKEDVCEIAYLAPLQRFDVTAIVAGHGLDAAAFMNQVRDARLGPLAARPITLKFLDALFCCNRLSSMNHHELYLNGCKQLCVEPSPSRRDAEASLPRFRTEILEAAEWLASVVVFSNRWVVYTGPDVSVPLTMTDVVCVSEFEPFLGRNGIPKDTLWQALGTALFNGIGGDFHTFAHRTYAEFLAAMRLVRIQASPDLVFRLLMDSETKDGQVVPQLAETAAWLASFYPEVFDSLIESDPKVLISSDVVRADDARKVRVAKAVLDGVLNVKFPVSEIDFYTGYRNLKCPELPEVLRPWIVGSDRDLLTRRIAIDIGRECLLPELLDAYVQVLNDANEPPHVRSWCSHAIADLNTSEAREALKPYLYGRDDDTDDELKGHALEAWWPEHMTTAEMVKCLSPRKKGNLHGAYVSFLYGLHRLLRPDDLAVVLPWVGQLEPIYRDGDITFEQVGEKILRLAWRHVYRPDVAQALAEAALAKAANYESILPADKNGAQSVSTEERQLVVVEVVKALDESRVEAVSHLIWHSPSLICPDDLVLVLQLRDSISPVRRRSWARLVDALNNASGWRYWAEILQTAETAPELQEQFKEWLGSVRLDDPQVPAMRKKWEESERQRREYERMNRRDRPKAMKPSPKERVSQWLEKAEAGDLNAWWVLNHELTLKPTSTHYEDVLEPDLTRLPGWAEADEDTRKRLLAVAKRFIETQDSKPDEWLGKGTYLYSALAGYRAILLLSKLDAAWVEGLPAGRWAAWAPSLIGYPSGISSPDHHEVQPRLVASAYRRAPDAVLAALVVLLDAEIEQSEYLPALHKMEAVWDDRLGTFLLNFAQRPGLRPSSLHEFVAMMAKHRYEPGLIFAESLLCSANAEGPERKRAVAVATALLLHLPTSWWARLWPYFERCPDFGRETFLEAVHPYALDDRRAWMTQLTPRQLGDLYLWMSTQFPRRDDPKDDHEGMHAVSPRESVAHLRDGVLRELSARASEDAAQALGTLAERCPEQPWIRQLHMEARRNFRRLAWHPASPGEVLRLLRPVHANGEGLGDA